MDFESMIDYVVAFAKRKDTSGMFAISDINGEWNASLARDQYSELIAVLKEKDSCVLTYHAVGFSSDDCFSACNKVLSDRIGVEYTMTDFAGRQESAFSIMSFLQENMGDLSANILECLTLIKKPLAAVVEAEGMASFASCDDLNWEDREGIICSLEEWAGAVTYMKSKSLNAAGDGISVDVGWCKLSLVGRAKGKMAEAQRERSEKGAKPAAAKNSSRDVL